MSAVGLAARQDEAARTISAGTDGSDDSDDANPPRMQALEIRRNLPDAEDSRRCERHLTDAHPSAGSSVPAEGDPVQHRKQRRAAPLCRESAPSERRAPHRLRHLLASQGHFRDHHQSRPRRGVRGR